MTETGQPCAASPVSWLLRPPLWADLPSETFPTALTVGIEIWESPSLSRALSRACGVKNRSRNQVVASSQPLLCRILGPLLEAPCTLCPSLWSLAVCLAVLVRATFCVCTRGPPHLLCGASERWRVGGTGDSRFITQHIFSEHLLSDQLCPVGCSDFAEGTPSQTLREIRADPVLAPETWPHCPPGFPTQGRDAAGRVVGPLPSHPDSEGR